ncbi:hypothetical protein HHI36_018887 [Cryptolaemus montrouzieri]|uniref:BUD13 homolog n=1 Tax=Cryptolaemus montrouzieri TaxID=559131 RepID=A0ABD2P234_9CUCU
MDETSKINQKEYLKKLKIIDDNLDIFNSAAKEDLLGESEDAPQIVEIIDDRPPSLMIDEKSNTHLWIPIGGNNVIKTENDCNIESKLHSTSKPKNESNDWDPLSFENITVKSERLSPISEDISPPRKKSKRDISNKNYANAHSSQKRNDRFADDDISPPRSIKTEYISPRMNRDLSPTRRKSRSPDMSPPRRKSNKNAIRCLNEKDQDLSPKRNKSSIPDMSPPRKYSMNVVRSPSRKTNSSNVSPIRSENKKNRTSDSIEGNPDMSPPRKKHNSIKSNTDKQRKSRWSEENTKNSKLIKTLDGKVAGLQNAKDLAVETEEIKRREKEIFANMTSEVSGVNAATIVRDKKTGRIRNFTEERVRNLEDQKKEDENKEKYRQWGKGLKQVEDANVKRAEEINEMSKPLARYADDEDLERYLKEQEWEGDPMAHLVRKKKKKKDIEAGKPSKPKYMGDFMPNRFGIAPGYRWDGVDRSNGYEKRWFEKQNSKLAQQEESYKWSTEDM